MDEAKAAPREIELWSEVGGSPRLFKLEGSEGFGIEFGGKVCIKPLAEWHRIGWESAIPSSTAFVPEGERKSLAGQAIEMAISALRDIQRRAPGTRTFFDYETFIERELVPAMAMADKDRQGCIGLMGLLAKEKLKVEELSKPVSAMASSPHWFTMASAPKTGTVEEILLLAEDRHGNKNVYVCHWAHGGGEDQPRFGPAWFYHVGDSWHELSAKPLGWAHLPLQRDAVIVERSNDIKHTGENHG